MIVHIKKKDKENKNFEGKINLSRRDFTSFLGGFLLSGCADSRKEIIYSHFNDPENSIPGNSVYYASTCGECKAGCGILAEVREGRVIKVEGNPDDPFSRGGTCALGQSTVQGLYDPNRIREPLERMEVQDNFGRTIVQFKPITASEALSKVATAIKNSNKRYFICDELDYLNQTVVEAFCSSLNFNLAQYQPFNHSDLQQAAYEVWGIDSTPSYDLSNVRIVVSFGAEFLEYWLDPVKFTKEWAYLRKNGLVYHYQFEPRCTLTGSKADNWIPLKPGTEAFVALALLKIILKLKKNNVELPLKLINQISKYDEDELISISGVKKDIVYGLASSLLVNTPALVLGGGVQAKGVNKIQLEKICLLINHCLGSVGQNITADGIKFRSNFGKVRAFLDEIQQKSDGKAIILLKGQFASWVPNSFALTEFRNMVKPGLIVAFSDILDDTAKLADIILPLNHPLESFSLNFKGGKMFLSQPVMIPLYKTKPLGEYLTILGKALEAKSAMFKVNNFEEIFTNEFTKFSSVEIKKALEKGVVDVVNTKKTSLTLRNDISINLNFDEYVKHGQKHKKGDKEVKLIPVGSVKAWDGRAHNRGWLLELHDPISLVCWESWVEISPKTSKKLGLKNRDIVAILTNAGGIECQVVVNKMMMDDTLAVPLGIISDSSASFSKLVKKSNSFKIFKDPETYGVVNLKITKIPTNKRGYQSQVTKSEEGRELIRVKQMYPNFSTVDHDHHSEHHAPKDLYNQREHPIFKWGMVVDLAACTGCSACVVACYAENNIPVVGPRISAQGRRMSWISIHQYEKHVGENKVRRVWLPLMCQQCNNAPCEPVCPVYATYHNEEGLNAMIYNRCVGTRYCANNCVYKVRRFNWFEYEFPESLKLQLNPDVTKRGVGVMEKCTFCIQRINEVKSRAKKEGRLPKDGEIKTACQQACPADAIYFGNLNDSTSLVSKVSNSDRGWKILDEYVNTKPSVTYLADMFFKV